MCRRGTGNTIFSKTHNTPQAAAASVAASATVGAAAAAAARRRLRRRRHDRRFHCYCCCCLVDCCLPPLLPLFPSAAAILACPRRCHRCCLPAPLPMFLPPSSLPACLFFCRSHHCLYVSTCPTASIFQRFRRRGRRCLCFDRHRHHSSSLQVVRR